VVGFGCGVVVDFLVMVGVGVCGVIIVGVVLDFGGFRDLVNVCRVWGVMYSVIVRMIVNLIIGMIR